MDSFIEGWQQTTNDDRQQYLKEALVRGVSDSLLSFIMPRYDRLLEALGVDAGLLDAIQQHRKERELSLKDSLQPRSGFIYRKSWHWFSIMDERDQCPELTELLQLPDAFIEQGQVIKTGKATTVAIVMSGKHRYFIKRYNVKGFFYGLMRSLIPSRAAVTWHAAQLLESIGVPTARPVALLEKRWGSVKKESYVVHEYVESIHAMTFFAEGAKPVPEWQSVADEMSNILYSLKRSLVIHGDLKAQNFIIHNNVPFLIDLDAMKSYRSVEAFERHYPKDLNRFSRNWINEPEGKKLFEPVLNRLQSGI